MKCVQVVMLALLAAGSAAAEDVERTMAADPDGTVTISNTAGSVEVRGWSRNEVEVKGELGPKVDELVFERDGDEILIKVRIPRNSSGDSSARLTVSVPVKSRLDVTTVSADIDVTGVEGELDLESVSGDVAGEAHAADIDMSSVSGDIEVVGTGGRHRSELVTVSGDVDAEALMGEISAESVSGDVALKGGAFERAELSTVNGEITYHAALEEGGRLDAETINGSIDIEFRGEVSARIDIETFNGRIRNCFGPEAVRTSKFTPGRELNFTEGDGRGRVRVQTLNGAVSLCR